MMSKRWSHVMPVSSYSPVAFWQTKIHNNIRRDELSVQTLEAMGWKVVTVWECDLKKDKRDVTLPSLAEQIRRNGASYASEQAQRRERNAEHRAMLKAAQERYDSLMKELGL